MKTWKLSARARAFGFISSVAASTLAASTALAGGENTVWFGPLPYGSQIDSAFGSPKNLILDDFEAKTRSPGLVIEGVNEIVEGNSVELDGTPGKSLMIGTWNPFNPGSAVLRFTAADIGGAPRQVGFVVTDASGIGMMQDISVTVNYADGSLPATRIFPVLSAAEDPSDDFFIGIDDAIGIESVVIASVAPISIDHVQYTGTVTAPLAAPLPDDFDGDGKSDVAWFSPGAKQSALWSVLNFSVSGGYTSIAQPTNTMKMVASGDSNADRKADILWYDTASCRYSVWIMNGLTAAPTLIDRFVGPEWIPVAFTDVDGDSKADVVFRSTGNGQTTVAVWLMDGASIRAGQVTVLAGEFEVVSIDDQRARQATAAVTTGGLGISAAQVAALPALRLVAGFGVGYDRVDIAAEAWSGPPADSIAWWRCRHPAAHQVGREPAPADALLDALEALEDSPDEPLRYLLALQLVRRRVLRMPDSREAHDDPDVLVLSCRRRGRDYRVRIAIAVDEGVEERLAGLLWSGEAA